MTDKKALKLALEALEAHADIGIKSDKAITAIKEALAQPPLTENGIYQLGYHNGYGFGEAYAKKQMAQPEQEPVAWRWGVPKLKNNDFEWRYSLNKTRPDAIPLYTTPPQRTWVGLTEDEIKECFQITPDQYLPAQIYKRIEAKLKEKNAEKN